MADLLHSMTDDPFKAPKRSRNRLDKSSPRMKRKRTKEDFFSFCNIVLAYTQYDSWKQEDYRSISPGLDSAGSSTGSITSECTNESSGRHELESDEWDLVTCFCHKPFAGRPMIECSKCNVWVHLSCAKIRKSNIPETYTCQACKDAALQKRVSNRMKMEKHRLSPS